jgi:ferritin-like metal-binding protein YciE
MATVDSLTTLLVDELRDIYDAEKRLTKAIPKLAKASTSDELRGALESHLSETEQHVTRLEQAFEHLDEPARRKPCAGMRGLIEEGDEHIKEDFEDDGLRDATIIGAAQRVEHYEMAAYGTAVAHARLLGQTEVAELLEETLAEEKAADRKLTDIADGVVNLDAAAADDFSGADQQRHQSMSSQGRSTASSTSKRRTRR